VKIKTYTAEKKALLVVLFLLFCQFNLLLAWHSPVNVFKVDSILPTLSQEKGINKKLEIPRLDQQDQPLFHTGFSLLFDEVHKQARWVAYSLTKNQRLNLAERTDKFIEDPLLSVPSASNQDYNRSGYDKGHLAPALDMSSSVQTMAESFYLTNISPQVPAFNRGIWKKLETLVRSWATVHDTLYIVTGPILSGATRSIGPNKVTVPEHFYKVIISNSNNKIKGIGFVLPNTRSNAELKDFSVSIDSVESLTKIDFFPALPDATEKTVEKERCISCWIWTATNKPARTPPRKPNTTVTIEPSSNNVTLPGNKALTKLIFNRRK
jgi:endonuclease G